MVALGALSQGNTQGPHAMRHEYVLSVPHDPDPNFSKLLPKIGGLGERAAWRVVCTWLLGGVEE